MTSRPPAPFPVFLINLEDIRSTECPACYGEGEDASGHECKLCMGLGTIHSDDEEEE